MKLCAFILLVLCEKSSKPHYHTRRRGDRSSEAQVSNLTLYLFEFVQFGDVCYAGQADIDEAEQLQVRELSCDSFDLPFTRATVVQDQLLDLREAGRKEELKSLT